MEDKVNELMEFYYQLKIESAESEAEKAKYEKLKEKGSNEYYETHFKKKK